ncbi:hypothetical protein DFJ77DRAFT_496068 [Powellomyces hirtus]|nr:hypothetical protein DFJ77DRAFT_496068 [Powellomyces hirtus]
MTAIRPPLRAWSCTRSPFLNFNILPALSTPPATLLTSTFPHSRLLRHVRTAAPPSRKSKGVPLARLDLRPQQPHQLHPPQQPVDEHDPITFEHHPEWKSYNRPRILRPILFSVCVVGLTFGVASYVRATDRWEKEKQKNYADFFGFGDIFSRVSSSTSPTRQQPPPHSLSPFVPDPVWRVKGMVEDWWTSARPALRVTYTIVGINVAVFCLWRIPSLHPFMFRHFAHHPLSGRSYTLLTSAFSHEGLMHLGFNMYALMGFAPLLQDRALGSTEQLVAFYLSAAVLASLGSHLVSVLWLNRFRPARPSLGASGAIWAILAGCATIFPHLPVGIIFLPGIQFTMGDLVPAMVALDLVGLFRNWLMFDHAAHLAGAAFGYLYITHGRVWWNKLQKAWDESRYIE